jgi:predicted small metal-binding protein
VFPNATWEVEMLAIDCECGHHLEAADVEALVEETRRHVAELHPEMQTSEDDIRALLEERCYEPVPLS